jgi:hypothetical protein
LVASDSEWDANLPEPWLSTAFALVLDAVLYVVVYVRDDLPARLKRALVVEGRRLGVVVAFVRRKDTTNLLATLLSVLPDDVRDDYRRVRLAHFFSPKDVEFALGWPPFRDAIHDGKVHQRSNLNGVVADARRRVRIRDLCGWAGKSSLAKLAAALGVPMADKGVMDDYKKRMYEGLLRRPEDFLRYAAADASVLLTLYERFVDFVRRTQTEVLGMRDDDLWHEGDIPMTQGRLAAETFRRWLGRQAGAYRDAVDFCCRKLGYLDDAAADYEEQKFLRLAVLARYRDPEALAAAASDPAAAEELRRAGKAKYLFTALEGAGVRWWASQSLVESAGYNALVAGGRCVNEMPFEFKIGPGLDVDISGCYGTVLRDMIYPVGLPSLWSYQPNEVSPTLAEWLRENEKDLVDGLWTCIVSGRLPFGQDLIYSRLVKASDLRKPVTGAGRKIPGDAALLRKQIENGVITAEVLKVLRAVATSSEWRALGRLRLVTAAAYLKKDRLEGAESWCRRVMAEPSEDGVARLEAGTPQDRRTRLWYGVPLEGFVGRLADERDRCKERQREAGGEEDRQHWQGRDAVLKLLINTLYGDMGSQLFAIGNTVVANNITARARVGVWMVAKALLLRQSITDGGIYTPSAVPYFNSRRKPGLATLARMWEWRSVRHGRGFKPMADRDWPAGVLPEDADELALAQVRSFWRPYGLEFGFTLAHKASHTFTEAAYWAKGDYALATAAGTVYKLRGKEGRGCSKKDDRKPHPLFALFDNILSGRDVFPEDLGFTKGGVLKIGRYKQAQNSRDGYAPLKVLRPGDNLPEHVYLARLNNTHMPMDDEATFLRRSRRKIKHRGEDVEWFERFRSGGIERVHRQMADDDLRSPGAPAVPPKRAKTGGGRAREFVTP